MRRNPARDAITSELEALGVAYTIGNGGRHPFVRIEHDGIVYRMPFAGTPSDHRSARNNRAQVRRLCKRLGLLDECYGHGERPAAFRQ